MFSPKRVGLTSLNGTIESLTALVTKFALLHSFQQTPPIALVTPGTAFVAGTITLRISSTRVISRRRSSHVSSAVFPSRTQVLSGSTRIESLLILQDCLRQLSLLLLLLQLHLIRFLLLPRTGDNGERVRVVAALRHTLRATAISTACSTLLTSH